MRGASYARLDEEEEDAVSYIVGAIDGRPRFALECLACGPSRR